MPETPDQDLQAEPDRFTAWMPRLLSLLAAGDICPRIDRVYPADEAGAAQLRLQQRANVGKVLLEFGGEDPA